MHLFKPGELCTPTIHSVHFFENKEVLVRELEAMHKMWTQVFKVRRNIAPSTIIMFLEEEFVVIPDPEVYTGFTLWKVLLEEKIGWVQADPINIRSIKDGLVSNSI